MIRLNVFIQVGQENRGEMIEVVKDLVSKSQGDNGCVAYDLFESATRNDVLLICETWKDADVLNAHEQTPHFISLVPKIQELGTLKIERFAF